MNRRSFIFVLLASLLFALPCEARRRWIPKPVGASYDAEAQAYFNAIVTNGGTISTASKGYINTFVLAAKAHSYWTKLSVFAPLTGDQLLAALVAFKPKTTNTVTFAANNFVSGDYTEATGLLGDGSTKYIDTGLLSTSLTANSSHLMVYNRSSSSNSGRHGAADGGGIFETYAPYGDATFYSDQYDTSSGRTASNSGIGTPYGFLVASRTASNSHVLYRNGSSVASSNTTGSGGTLTAINVYFFAVNSGSGAAGFADCRLAAFSFGDGLTSGDVSNYSTDLNALQTSLGRNTY